MRKLFTVWMIMLTIATGDFATVKAQNSGTAGPLTWTYDPATTTLTISGTGNMPEYQYGLALAPWDAFKESMTRVVIEEGVTSISAAAFGWSNHASSVSKTMSLASVVIPSSVTKIGSLAFFGCRNLTSVSIPAGVTEIGDGAFSDCNSLQSVIIPAGVTKIERFTFFRCRDLHSVTLPTGVMEIGENAFGECRSLTSVVIPSTVTRIGDVAFAIDESLSSITVAPGNSNYVSVDGVLFDRAMTTLIQYPCNRPGTTYTIPNGVSTITKSAFAYAKNLTLIDIPSSVTRIEENAIEAIPSLKELKVAWNTPLSIARNVFGVHGLAFSRIKLDVPKGTENTYRNANVWKEFSISNPTPTPDPDAFRWDYNAATRTLTISGKGDMPEYQYEYALAPWDAYKETMTRVVIEEGITSISTAAFGWSNHASSVSKKMSLTSVVIPSTVKKIGSLAFFGCGQLTSVSIPAGVTKIGDGAFSYCSSLQSVVIPAGVTEIERYTFSECRSLQSVSLPAGITTIGESAFSRCHKLTSVSIPGNVREIGSNAFENCGLETLSIPQRVTTILDQAFTGCNKLKTVTVNWTQPIGINRTVFNGVNLSEVTLNVPSGSEATYLAAPVWKEFRIRRPDYNLDALFTTSGNLAADGTGRKSLQVTSHADGWIASASEDWLGFLSGSTTVGSVSYSGNQTLTVVAKPNPNLHSRNARITFKSSDGRFLKEVFVGQDGLFKVTYPKDLFENISAGGFEITIQIRCKVAWTSMVRPFRYVERSGAATTRSNANNIDVPWVETSFKPATGSLYDGTMTIKVLPNTTASPRAATLYFVSPNGGNVADQIEVKQAAGNPSLQVGITGIALDKTAVTVNGNAKTVQLKAVITPSNATNKALKWTSSDAFVASVDADGMVTIHKKGAVVITASTTDGSNKTASCAFTVLSTVSNTYITHADIYAHENTLHLSLPHPERVYLYNVNGRLVHTFDAPAGNTTLSLEHGIYIVKTSSLTKQIFIK